MRLSLSVLAIITGCITTLSPQATLAATFSLVADGLDNPRGLSFGLDGALYVTEAGSGGTGACLPSPNGSDLCYGTSGAVTKIQPKSGTQERVLTNLPSLAAEGSSSFGAQDIKFDPTGNPYVLLGYGADPALRDSVLPNADLGKLVSANFATNSWTTVADLANYEVANNPDRADIGSNPTTFLLDGDKAIIADAGANTLLGSNIDGSKLQAIATLPEQIVNNPVFPPSDSVPFDPTQVPNGDGSPSEPAQIAIQPTPTGVAKGPDGAYYVSLFTGFPFPEGGAKVYRVDPNGETSVYADGFTQLTDLEFDAQGNLYALQYANESAWKGNLDASLIEIAADGTRSTLVSGERLEAASSLAISPDGALYVSSQSDRPGGGKVWRIDNTKPVPEPASMLGILAFGVLGMGIKNRRTRNCD
ncbi:ScyD/ScyE family protein [Aliterella atlantica]|uniref:NHL repeat containing protein n=1 Tax=Aliterella atlantica CENA595 TaxID=1618023 RepID=A0A0D8ZX67_9CYAN|nr:ScyD/ScyE family protein [Aliterella atlantica]KJH73358.1 NHL repeat containing protein [Aliterella atlantica CENA595]